MTKCTTPIDPNSIIIPKKPANKSASEHRKITKPIMEKRRRARINHSLEQLKEILIHQFKECSKKSNNLEKADILELTVKHLKDITAKQNQLNQLISNQKTNNFLNNQQFNQLTQINNQQLNNNSLNVLNKNLIQNNQEKKVIQLMQSGFQDCKEQVNERVSKVDKRLSERLNSHLTKFGKQKFDQSDFNQVLNLSLHDHYLANSNHNSQPVNLSLLHTPSSASSSTSSNVFFPHNSHNGGSLSPNSERSLSPSSSDSSVVWRPW